MAYRDDLDALRARVEALERQLAEVTRERDEALAALARGGGRVPGLVPRPPPPHVQDPPRPVKVKLERSERDELAQAKSDRDQLLSASPDVPALANVAERLFRLGDWDGARTLYERMLGMYLGEPNRITRADVCQRLGQVLVKLDRRTEAMEMYQRGLRHAPQHAGLLAAVADLGK